MVLPAARLTLVTLQGGVTPFVLRPLTKGVAGMARSRRVYLLVGALMVGVLMAFSGSALGATQTVALWHMEDPSQLIDDSGQNNNGTTNNITSVPGSSGNGYHFNGTSSIATVPSSSSLNPGSADITFTAHVRFTQPPSATVGDYDLLRKGLSTSAGGDYKMEILPRNNHTKAKGFCFFKDSAKTVGKIVNGPNLADGAWHTISCTKTPQSVVLTVDGTPYATAVQLGSISNSDLLTIGAQSRNVDWYVGDMDEVSVEIG
jgi:Concanavalin A-like lectin/glucanases superfamily